MKFSKYLVLTYYALAIISFVALVYAIYTKEIYQANIILFLLWAMLFTIRKILVWKMK